MYKYFLPLSRGCFSFPCLHLFCLFFIYVMVSHTLASRDGQNKERAWCICERCSFFLSSSSTGRSMTRDCPGGLHKLTINLQAAKGQDDTKEEPSSSLSSSYSFLSFCLRVNRVNNKSMDEEHLSKNATHARSGRFNFLEQFVRMHLGEEKKR